MARSDPRESPQNLIAFAKNVYACVDIIGSRIESFALRTDIKVRVFADYLEGKGFLSDDVLKAVCAELRLDDTKLKAQFEFDEQRRITLKHQLRAKGFIVSSSAIGAAAHSKAPQVEMMQLTQEEPIKQLQTAIEEEPMAEEMGAVRAQYPAIKWDDEDLLGTATTGQRFNLRGKECRASLIGHIREIIAEKGETLASFFERASLKKSSSWLWNVEKGTTRIYGTEVESIAEALDVSVFSLLSVAAERVAEEETPAELPVVVHEAAQDAQPGPSPETDSTVEQAQPDSTVPPIQPEQAFVPIADIEVPAASFEFTDAAQNSSDDKEYFRRLVLNADTRPAEGYSFGQLLVLAADPESVDWHLVYLTHTAAGQEFTASLKKVREQFSGLSKPLQHLYLAMLLSAHK